MEQHVLSIHPLAQPQLALQVLSQAPAQQAAPEQGTPPDEHVLVACDPLEHGPDVPAACVPPKTTS